MATPQKLADTGIEAAKSSPPIAVLAVTAQGMTLQEWVYAATLVYIALQAGWLLWKWWKAFSTKGWTPRDD
jgi:hypothetical protein